jgi:ketosteroid isomerase-like protein
VLDGLLVRVPALAGLMGAGLRRVPPGSSLRRRLVRFQVKRGFAAMARSDVAIVVLFYEPDAEVWMQSMSGVGVGDCYHGPEGIRTLYGEIDEVFADWAWTIRALADGGDRIAVRADFVGHGRSSGVKTDLRDGGMAIKFSARNLIAWQEWFVEPGGWGKALQAVGLSEQDAHAEPC